MKKILLAVLLSTPLLFSQQINGSKILQLENSVSNINNKYLPTQSILSSNTEFTKKNAGLAVLFSLILPGMGELYADSYQSGKYFTIAEGALWGIYIGMDTYGNWEQSRYQSYAATTAGINPAGKDSKFYANIADYTSITEFNNDQALSGNFNGMYDTKADYWNWPTTADRKDYRTMWVNSQQANNDLRFVVGAMIINRIASAINAVRLVHAYNSSQDIETSWNFSVGVKNSITLPTSVTFNFQSTF
jgi:hypothetical protein